MATTAFQPQGQDDFPTEKRESHWFPALRPNADDYAIEPREGAETATLQPYEPAGSDTNLVGLDVSATLPASPSSHPALVEQDDGKLDPAWGITRTDSAHILDGVQRTTSFPAIQPEPLADVVTTGAQPQDVPAVESNPEPFLHPIDDDGLLEDEDDVPNVLENVVMNSEIPEQDQGSIGLLSSRSATGRFDEGVPLLASQQEIVSQEPDIHEAHAVSNPFDSVAATDEAAFFSQANSQPEQLDVAVPRLDRKSTAEVLDSLSFAGDGTDSPTGFFRQLGQDDEKKGGVEVQDETVQGKVDDKWAAIMGDDEFLLEDDDDLLPDSEPGSPSSFIASLQNDNINVPESSLPPPQSQQQPLLSAASHVPHQPSTSEMVSSQSKAYGYVGITRPGLNPLGSVQSHAQQVPISMRAESFADQSKGGYKSPYDLPLDISKSRKKPQPQRTVSQPQRGMPPPPPRNSSISSDKPAQSPYSSATVSGSIPTTPYQALASGPHAGTANEAKPPAARQSSSSSFFEELPAIPRQRPSNSGRYTPSQAGSVKLPVLPPPGPPTQRALPDQPQTMVPGTSDPFSQQYQLRPPERVDPYANLALQPPATQSAPTSTRYSPAPTSAHGPPKPSPSPRYSPAPPPQPSAGAGRYASQPGGVQAAPATSSAGTRYASQPASTSNPALPFQPRTSSPLASHRRSPSAQSNMMPPPPLPRSVTSNAASDHSLHSRPIAPADQSVLSPPRRPDAAGQPSFTPPKRSQTQSPGRQRGTPSSLSLTNNGAPDRPASAFGNLSPTKATGPGLPVQSQLRPRADELDFIIPSDETGGDPLQRWKGAPIFRFGFGGTVVTSFPTRTPRYASGLLKPQMKAGVGDVKVQKSEKVWTMPERSFSFPGPLRGKSKKKDLLVWLTSSITRLEAESPTFLGLAQTLPDPRKRHEEKILLWRIVKTLVEHDGHLETLDALKAVNSILAPEVYAIDESTASQYKVDTERTGIYGPGGSTARTDAVDALAVESLRKHILKGNRKDAVWHAVDNRLWSHALLIASTLKNEPAVWKQVVQEFVRQEVKTIGNNAESLSAMYEIFGGNLEESIDQLVPPSARAGLQMVSTVDSIGPVKNALDGLDKWKETLTMVLNNRSDKDYRALVTLARLLSDYGRVEASHICLLFARNLEYPAILGGLDDQHASIVLLGADQRLSPKEIHLDEDAVLLTEAYEFATCTLSGTTAAVPLPHLAAYKLQRAKDLADHGHKTEAQAYCDAVAAGLKSGSKVSPYYHPLLLAQLDELNNRIKQIPVQSSSWMSKPSIEKVSGSIFSKFTNFVAGEDSDAASQGSGKDASADVGPFANVTGSPNLSRSGSQTDLYGSYPAAPQTIPQTFAGSRYAPNGVVSARSSSELVRGRPSLDSQRSPPGSSYGQESKPTIYSPMGLQNSSPARSNQAYQPLGTSPGQNFGTSPALSHYQATPPQSGYMPSFGGQPQSVTQASTPPPAEHSSYMPSVPEPNNIQKESEQSPYGGYLPSEPSDAVQSYGYEPPGDTGYVPYQPDPDSDEDSKVTKPKKKSFMDDDQDDYPRVSGAQSSGPVSSAAPSTDASTAARRKANDEAAEAAFRAAAEADAQRAKEATTAKRSSGWFGGWLGGGKKAEESLDAKSSGAASDQKVTVAKLGENKMKLYYDKDLKKWINPDDPDSAKAKGATPPPPRMGGTPAPPMGGAPPPRSASGGSPMPPPVLSRSNTPASAFGLPPGTSDSGNGVSNSLPPSVGFPAGSAHGATPPLGASSVPLPTPTGTTPLPPASTPPIKSAAAASSIDDLLGPPTGGARRGVRGAKKVKGGRYVDVMAK